MDWAAAIKQVEFTSDQQVARAMSEAPSWPKDDAPKTIRSLGNKVSELKRGELGWWCGAKGRRFRPALAEVLRLELLEVDRAIDSASKAGAEVLPFDVFPELRPFDPAKDDLLPGIPRELTTIPRFLALPVWWVAAPGAGRRMVGAWLRARQHWRVVDAEHWADVENELVDGARLFVRLKTALGVPEQPKIPSDASLIVAAAFDPPEPDDEGRGGSRRAVTGWRVIRSAPAEEWAEALIDWVDARLDDRGGFTRESAVELLEQPSVLALLSTPGDLLDLLALFDHLGERLDPDPKVMFRAFIRLAIQRTALSEADGRRLREHAWPLLHGMTRTRLHEGLGASLDEATWARLVQTPVVSREALSELAADARLQVNELRSRLKELSEPNGEDVVDLLRRTRLLRPVGGGDGLALTPPWLSALVVNTTAQIMADEGAASFGTLVVHPETARLALLFLYGDLMEARATRVESLIAAPSPGPDAVAARALALRSVGLALVGGLAVPEHLVQAAWDIRHACTFQRYRNFPPVPRVPPANEHGDDNILGTAAHLLAMLAIAERITTTEDAHDPFVAAWHQQGSSDHWIFQTDLLEGEDFLDHGDYQLGGRLVDRIGPTATVRGVPRFQHPYVLFKMSQGVPFDLPPMALLDVLDLRFPPHALDVVCEASGSTTHDVLRWCWTRWTSPDRQTPPPPVAWLTHPGFDGERGAWPERRDDVWAALPVAAMNEPVMQFLASESSGDVWEVLSADHQFAWASWWRQQPRAKLGAVLHLPDELFFSLYKEGVGVDGFFPHDHLWKVQPEEMLAAVSDLVRKPPVSCGPGRDSLAMEILFAAPPEMTDTALDLIDQVLSETAILPESLRHLQIWLHTRVERRAPSWRRAYELLDRLDPAM